MKAPPFDYFAPETLEEALGLLHEYGDEAKVLAGGQSLVPLLALRLARPSVLVDLRRVPGLASVERGNGTVRIGAMVRETALERSATLRESVPLLAAAAPLIGHPAIRTRGTVGGSVAHADPAAEIPAIVLALDAELVARRWSGERTISAAEFFQGFLTTVLEPDEALVELRFPAAGPGTGVCFEEVARRHGDFAIVGAAASVELDDGRVADCRVALIGVGGTPMRRPAAEQTLTGQAPSNDAIAAAAAAAAENLEPASDLHGSATYRRHLARVVTARALRGAVAHTGRGPGGES
jgi:carbon-monoxide dehydrogenase medium subunit